MNIYITASYIEKGWLGYHTVETKKDIEINKNPETSIPDQEKLQEALAAYLTELKSKKVPIDLNIKIPNKTDSQTNSTITAEINKYDFIGKKTVSNKSLSPLKKEQLNNMALHNAHKTGLLLGLLSGVLSSHYILKILVNVVLTWATQYLREKDVQWAAAKYDSKAKIKNVTSSFEKCALKKGLEADTWLGYGKTFFSFSCWWNRRACIGAMRLTQNDEFDLTNTIKLKI